MTEPLWHAQDLRHVVNLALERGGPLLTAGERLQVDQLDRLSEAALEVFAWLAGRKPRCFRVDKLSHPRIDASHYLAELLDRQLIDELVLWPERAANSTVAELREACTQLGLPKGGSKPELVERVGAHTHWSSARWIRVRHKRLLRRLERWAWLSRYRDRSQLVLERIGVLSYPAYTPTPGVVVHPHRRQLLGWEALHAARDQLAPDLLLRAYDAGLATAPAGLDLSYSVAKRVLNAAREAERAGAHEQALQLYQALHARTLADSTTLAIRQSRVLEHQGRLQDAAELLLATRKPQLSTPGQLALERAGRRTCKRARVSWPPAPPLKKAPTRTWQLPTGPKRRNRPTWLTPGGEPHNIEAACLAHLRASGRDAIFAENSLWTTLFAGLTADLWFLPVARMLPVSRLPGPLDLYTPAFFARRREPLEQRLEQIRADAASILHTNLGRYEGTQLIGAHWGTYDGHRLTEVVASLPGATLSDMMRTLLEQGGAATRGLPDLFVFAGPAVSLDHAFPATLPATPLLLEVKGPSDSVRDEQAWWHDRLLGTSITVEVLHVSPRG